MWSDSRAPYSYELPQKAAEDSQQILNIKIYYHFISNVYETLAVLSYFIQQLLWYMKELENPSKHRKNGVNMQGNVGFVFLETGQQRSWQGCPMLNLTKWWKTAGHIIAANLKQHVFKIA